MIDDDRLLQQFEDCSYPFDEWHHRAHVRVAWIYLTRFGLEAAEQRLRAGIQTYNAAHGVVDGPASGYHETMTMAWLRVIHATMAIYGAGETSEEFFDFHPQLSQKKILRLFYSPGRFTSAEAKRAFLEPDLTDFPGRKGDFGIRGKPRDRPSIEGIDSQDG
jgi:hypothetical protein